MWEVKYFVTIIFESAIESVVAAAAIAIISHLCISSLKTAFPIRPNTD